jgi:CheY-like chemotaxis protein
VEGQRPFDLVLFGATGFTGALTAEYLAAHAPAGTRWALAGRNRAKLEALRERLGTAGVEPAEATELLERISRLAQEAAADAAVVLSLTTAEEALGAARRETFDVLLTDMVMPGMSGRDLARELVREYPNVRVVYMSGYHAGAPVPDWQFIAKPFDRQILLAKIGHVQPGGAPPPA